jgi:hypothetical protein
MVVEAVGISTVLEKCLNHSHHMEDLEILVVL